MIGTAAASARERRPTLPFRPNESSWPISTGQVGMRSPVYGDFDLSRPGDEVIVTVACIRINPIDEWTLVYAMHADGSFMEGWGPRRIEDGAPHDGPALGDLDHDGTLELVLSLYESPTSHSYVTVLKPDGSVAPGRWPIDIGGGVTSSPVLADLDGDDQKEVLVACMDGKLYVWRNDGASFRPGFWPKDLGGILYDSPAVGHLTREFGPKIVIGSSMRAPGTATLHLLDPDGTSVSPNWPRVLVDRDVFTPSIADIDLDGEAEIVIGAGSHLGVPGHVYAFKADGSDVGGSWPVEVWDPEEPFFRGGYPYMIAIGDLDPGYPGLEMVTAPGQKWKVYALHSDGTLVPGWPYVRRDSVFVGNPVAIGDLDGVLGLDVAAAEGRADWGGRLLFMIRAEGTDLPGSPRDLGGFMPTGPAIGDIDHDGRVEIIQPVAGTGMIELLEIDGPGVDPDNLVWPMQQHDACRTGFYPVFPEAHVVPGPPIWPAPAIAWDGPPLLTIRPPVASMATRLVIQTARPGRLSLEVFDSQGRKVATLADGMEMASGVRTFLLPETGSWACGVYFVRASLRSPKGIESNTSRLVIVR